MPPRINPRIAQQLATADVAETEPSIVYDHTRVKRNPPSDGVTLRDITIGNQRAFFFEYAVDNDGWSGLYAIGTTPEPFFSALRQAVSDNTTIPQRNMRTRELIGQAIVNNVYASQPNGTESSTEPLVIKNQHFVNEIKHLIAALSIANERADKAAIQAAERRLNAYVSSRALCSAYLSDLHEQRYVDAISLEIYVNLQGKELCLLAHPSHRSPIIANNYDLTRANPDDVYIIFFPVTWNEVPYYNMIKPTTSVYEYTSPRAPKQPQPPHPRARPHRATLFSSEHDPQREQAQERLASALADTGFTTAPSFRQNVQFDINLFEMNREDKIFLDSCAQALNRRRNTQVYSLEQLHRLCIDYAKGLDQTAGTDNWIFNALNSDETFYQSYVQYAGFPRDEINNLRRALNPGDDNLIWGEQIISARIICEKLGVRIHMVSLDDDGRLEHHIVTPSGRHEVAAKDVAALYEQDEVIHIAAYRDKFAPVVQKFTPALLPTAEPVEQATPPTHTWQGYRVKPYGFFITHLGIEKAETADSREIGISWAALHHMCHEPLYLASFDCSGVSPLDELLIARFPKGQFVIMVLPKPGVRKQVMQVLKAEPRVAGYVSKETNITEVRKPWVFVTTGDKDESMREIMTLIERVHQISPFDPTTAQQIIDLLQADNLTGETQTELTAAEATKTIAETPYMLSEDDFFTCEEEARAMLTVTEEIPPLHRAVIARDFSAVKAIVEADPYTALQHDARGFSAYELADALSPDEIWFYLCDERKKLITSNVHDQIQENIFIERRSPSTFGIKQATDAEFAENLGKYEQIPTYTITRPALHQACLDGDLATVEAELARDPQQLQQQDPRGFTPLLLAVMGDHVEIVRALILKHKTPVHIVPFIQEYINTGRRWHFFHPVMFAKNRAILQLLLQNYDPTLPDDIGLSMATGGGGIRSLRCEEYPKVYSNRLRQTMLDFDLETAKLMLFHMPELVKDKFGKDVFELLMTHKPPEGDYTAAIEHHFKEFFRLFLAYLDDYIPEGPYDNGADFLIPLAAAHNQAISRRKARQQAPPIVTAIDTIPDRGFMTRMTAGEETFTTHTMRLNDLAESAVDTIFELFNANLQMRENDSEPTRRAYLEKMLLENKNPNAFIDLFFNDDGMIGFVTYEVQRSQHPDCDGPFLLLHGQLAGILPQHAGHGLTRLMLRTLFALRRMYPELPIVFYGKIVPPGLGLQAVLPKIQHMQFYPKDNAAPKAPSHALMEHVVELTGEKVSKDEHTISTKLVVDARPQQPKMSSIFVTSHVGAGVENAMPLGVFFNAQNRAQYRGFLESIGVTDANLAQSNDEFQKLFHTDCAPTAHAAFFQQASHEDAATATMPQRFENTC